MLLAGTSVVFAESTSSDNTTFAENFANPDRSTHAGIRFWLPGAPEDLEELKTEIRSLAEVGIKVDLTVGPHWPLSLPSITPDSEASSKELQQGTLVLAPGETFEGAVPICDTPLDEGNSFDQLKAVTVARISGVVENEDEEDDTVTYTVDSSTIQTVDVAEDGTISFTADQADDSYNADDPNNVGKWLITSYWMRGTSQTVNGLGGVQFTEPRSYVVDHFSKEGSQAFIDFWKENILTDDVVELLKDVGGSIFEDSLEVSGDIMWSNDLLDYFQEHRGYDLTPYLPVLYGEVTAVNDYVQNDDGTITLSISLEPRDSILLAISEDESYADGAQTEKEVQPEVETMELKNWNLSVERYGCIQDCIRYRNLYNRCYFDQRTG